MTGINNLICLNIYCIILHQPLFFNLFLPCPLSSPCLNTALCVQAHLGITRATRLGLLELLEEQPCLPHLRYRGARVFESHGEDPRRSGRVPFTTRPGTSHDYYPWHRPKGRKGHPSRSLAGSLLLIYSGVSAKIQDQSLSKNRSNTSYVSNTSSLCVCVCVCQTLLQMTLTYKTGGLELSSKCVFFFP